MASDLGLHCIPLSHKMDDRLIWVKEVYYSITGIAFCNAERPRNDTHRTLTEPCELVIKAPDMAFIVATGS